MRKLLLICRKRKDSFCDPFGLGSDWHLYRHAPSLAFLGVTPVAVTYQRQSAASRPSEQLVTYGHPVRVNETIPLRNLCETAAGGGLCETAAPASPGRAACALHGILAAFRPEIVSGIRARQGAGSGHDHGPATTRPRPFDAPQCAPATARPRPLPPGIRQSTRSRVEGDTRIGPA